MSTRKLALLLSAALPLLALQPASTQERPGSGPYYEEDVPASNPIRSEQARELGDYIQRLKSDPTRLH
ncbi:MAG TPA: hypothetical protein VFU47_08485, partial [Armatimonadota bacterium]|nr:hypothetical protein [Armatimonadota bacterium]